MSRWKTTIDDNFQLKVEPNIDELSKWLNQASKEISRKIAENEELLLIQNLPSHSLEMMRRQITKELKRRRDFKL